MINLAELIKQANQLRPLPASAVRLVGLASHPDSDLSEVVQLVEYDQILTLKMLRAANSMFSASATPVGTVREAVQRMGTAQVQAFAVAASTRPFLQNNIPAYGLGEGALWRHSVAAAVAVETLQACGLEMPADAFTAALLHDIGKLVMGRFLSPEILGFIAQAQEVDHLTQIEAESQLLNVHHGELGGLIAQHWQLPRSVVQGIIWHHNPAEGHERICDVTYLANLLAKQIECGLDGQQFELTVDLGVVERLGLVQDKLDSFGPRAAARYAEVCHLYDAE
jgi:HD-like signal output (HDOD) protein